MLRGQIYLCNAQITGKYRINFIYLLILSELQYLGCYITEEVPSAETLEGDLWLWLVSLKPMSQQSAYSSLYLPMYSFACHIMDAAMWLFTYYSMYFSMCLHLVLGRYSTIYSSTGHTILTTFVQFRSIVSVPYVRPKLQLLSAVHLL